LINITETGLNNQQVQIPYYVDVIPYVYYFKYNYKEELVLLVENSSFIATATVRTKTGIHNNL
jgi:hypothetical protein